MKNTPLVEKKKPNASDKNIINIMEERLSKLKLEKEEIEKIYGVSEENLKQTLKIKKESTPTIHNKDFKKLNKQHKLENLPSLELKIKKEEKLIYKTPDSLTDALKYEPNIDDLYDKKEFESNFFSLESLKCIPTNSKIDDSLISSFYENRKERFIKTNFK